MICARMWCVFPGYTLEKCGVQLCVTVCGCQRCQFLAGPNRGWAVAAFRLPITALFTSLMHGMIPACSVQTVTYINVRQLLCVLGRQPSSTLSTH